MSFSPSILTKGEQSHSAKNKHPYLSLLPQCRQREPRTSTMEVKCLLYLPRRSTVAISPSITSPGSENTGSHYRTKGSLIDWLTDMNFQRPKGQGRNQKDGRTMQFACMDLKECNRMEIHNFHKTPFIADYTLEHEWLGVFDFEKAIDICLKKASIHPYSHFHAPEKVLKRYTLGVGNLTKILYNNMSNFISLLHPVLVWEGCSFFFSLSLRYFIS